LPLFAIKATKPVMKTITPVHLKICERCEGFFVDEGC